MRALNVFRLPPGDLLLDEEAVLGKTINGYEMKKLLNNTWLRDRSAIITARMEFGDVQFSNDVNVRVSG